MLIITKKIVMEGIIALKSYFIILDTSLEKYFRVLNAQKIVLDAI